MLPKKEGGTLSCDVKGPGTCSQDNRRLELDLFSDIKKKKCSNFRPVGKRGKIPEAGLGLGMQKRGCGLTTLQFLLIFSNVRFSVPPVSRGEKGYWVISRLL